MPRFLLDSTKRASRRGLLGKLENIAVYLILFFLCFAAVILAFPANGQLQGKEIQVISAFLAGGDIAVLCVLWRLKRLDPKTLMFLLFLLGVLMRLSYAAAYPAEDRQHDVFDADGHLQYILRLADTWRLPDSNNWQYNHPPLHHLLAAVWVKVFQWFGVTDQAQLAETLQFLTCFYSCAMLAVVYRIFDENPFGRRAVPLAYALVCLHPTFYLLAGSLNNDCLMVLLFFTAVLYTLRWYRDPSLKNSLTLAVAIGCCMMAKVSGDGYGVCVEACRSGKGAEMEAAAGNPGQAGGLWSGLHPFGALVPCAEPDPVRTAPGLCGSHRGGCGYILRQRSPGGPVCASAFPGLDEKPLL